MNKKTALITGINGQDGSYLAELLLKKDYRIIGLTRDPATKPTDNTKHIYKKIEMRYCTYDLHSVSEVIDSVQPDEVYNFAGQTYVGKSWEMLDETFQASGILPCYFLEAIARLNRKIKFFQASSSEIFYPALKEKLTEKSILAPHNPYGCSKAFAHNMVKSYRQNYGLYAVNGILFNHESERRHENFLCKKIVRTAARIKLGIEDQLVIGNTQLIRDWGYAPDYMEAVHKMLHMSEPEDLIIASGVSHSIESIARQALELLDLDYDKYVRVDPTLFRPFEAPEICVDIENTKAKINWSPKTSFSQMFKIMVDHELALQKKETQK